MDRPDDNMHAVLREMCGGSTAAFDRFYAKYAPFILQVASRIMTDRMEAEDVCHDVFLDALRKGGQYDPGRGSIEAWLAVMTRSSGEPLARADTLALTVEPSGGSASPTSPDAFIFRLQHR